MFFSNLKTKELQTVIPFGTPVTAVSCSNDGNLVALGFIDGVVRILDNIAMDNVRVVFAERMQEDGVSVTSILFHPDNGIIIVFTSDRKIFFLRVGYGAFELLGHTIGPQNITCVNWVKVAGVQKLFVGTRTGVVVMITPPRFDLLVPENLIISHLTLNLIVTDIKMAPLAIGNDPLHEQGFFVLALDKKLKRYKLDVYEHPLFTPIDMKTVAPEDSAKILEGVEEFEGGVVVSDLQTKIFKELDLDPTDIKESVAQWDDEYYGHNKFGTAIAVSRNGELVATGGADGLVIIR